jgi:hypothetical protein
MFRNKADKFKIISSYIIGGIAILFCLGVASRGPGPVVQILLCILGGAVGWCIGLYLTPSDDGERKTLSEAGKLALTLLSGIGLGKIDDISAAVARWAPADQPETPLRLLLILCTVIIGALFTYISRLFVKGEDAELRTQRTETIAELRRIIAKLEGQN